uniref:MIT domain-containing protein n=1 Tax=Caenorhabditis japonica TaxID=281687 RepID=A0A8R1HRQ3_CAEJA
MGDQSMKLVKKAAPILQDAVTDDNKGKASNAIFKYKRGVELLGEAMRLMPFEDDRRNKIMSQFTTYVKRIAQLEYANKTEVSVDQRRIAANSTGNGYHQVFSRCCDDTLKMVHVQDAYIVAHHQLLNFVRFCEVIVPLAKNLLVITLKTGEDARNNQTAFQELAVSLEKRGIVLYVEFSQSLHDREIIFDNGWVVKSGRGLDYFKPPEGKYALGACDMNLRPCHETIIDTFKRKK